jgi:hypothetical protein
MLEGSYFFASRVCVVVHISLYKQTKYKKKYENNAPPRNCQKINEAEATSELLAWHGSGRSHAQKGPKT